MSGANSSIDAERDRPPSRAPRVACARPPAGSRPSGSFRRPRPSRRKMRRPSSRGRSRAVRGSRRAPARRCARMRAPAAMLSVKLISAMPSASGHSFRRATDRGFVNDGNPAGTAPTVSTPCARRPNSATATIAAATTNSGAGARGTKRSSSTQRGERQHRERERARRDMRQTRDERTARYERTILSDSECRTASATDPRQ